MTTQSLNTRAFIYALVQILYLKLENSYVNRQNKNEK